MGDTKDSREKQGTEKERNRREREIATELGDGRRKRHHRCNLCGKDFESGADLRDHVERRHPKADVHWWVVAEDPERDLQFSR